MIQPAQEMIDSLQPSTLEYCKNNREPNFPYVLLEKPKHYVKMDGRKSKNGELKYCIRTIRLDGRPDQLNKIKQNLENDGERLIAWGNFPQASDPSPKNQQLISLHRDRYGITPWDSIHNYLINLCKRNNSGYEQVKKMESEVERLVAELEEEKLVNAKLKDKNNK